MLPIENATIITTKPAMRLTVGEDWHGSRFGEVQVDHADEMWHFQVQAYLGDLCADCVRVQLYGEPLDGKPQDGEPAGPVTMQLDAHTPLEKILRPFFSCTTQ